MTSSGGCGSSRSAKAAMTRRHWSGARPKADRIVSSRSNRIAVGSLGMLSGTAQTGRRGAVHGAVGGERDAIVAQRDIACVEPVGDIGGDLLGVALGRIAKAAAARQFEPGEIAAGDRLPSLRADRLAGDQR